MTAEAVEQKSFPYMSVAIWAMLRRTFFKNVPKEVTKTYLASALSISMGTAGNVLPQLKNIGIVDKDGIPTELGKEFRFDASYGAACKSIITTLYPHELRDLYADEDADLESVAHWFMRRSGSSQASSMAMAKFYLHLVAGEPPADDIQPRSAKRTQSATPTKTAPKTAGKSATQPVAAQAQPVHEAVESPAQATHAPTKSRHPEGPSLHIDMQVHIDPAATPEQIDSIFASMAKHLYGR